MHPSVRTGAKKWFTASEASSPYMYLDVKGFVTIGIGRLLSTSGAATVLPFVYKSDQSKRATPGEIASEYALVKTKTEWANKKDHLKLFGGITALCLPNTSVDAVFENSINGADSWAKKEADFADFDNWPADAQLAIISIIFAMGSVPSQDKGRNKWTVFRKALKEEDFLTAANNSEIIDTRQQDALKKRNDLQYRCLMNAYYIVTSETRGELVYDRPTLYYPTVLDAPGLYGQTCEPDSVCQ
jgi:hypothetical protein